MPERPRDTRSRDHGEVVTAFAAALDTFFDQPLEAKERYRTPPEVDRGYAPPRTESLSLSLGLAPANRMHDFFEAFNIGSARSDHPDLDLPAGFFEGYTDHSLDVLRMNNYALEPGEVEPDGELTGMGEHTDYGIVTVLWTDRVAGLQVLGADGAWHHVMPDEEALLVNLGDLMARWTNERWMSTLHRVKPPVVDGRVERRRSAAYFHDGNVDALVSTLETCVGEGSRYEPITVGEHIAAKLAGSRAGVANRTAAREAARVLASREG